MDQHDMARAVVELLEETLRHDGVVDRLPQETRWQLALELEHLFGVHGFDASDGSAEP